MAVLAGSICKFIDGRDRQDGKIFAFIRPEDGNPNVFAPIHALDGLIGDHNQPKLLDYLRQAAIDQKKVLFQLKDDGHTNENSMPAMWWKMADGYLPVPGHSASRSAERSRSRSDSRKRSRSKRRPRTRSPSRRSNSPSRDCKVTICDIPSDMTPEELAIIGGNIGDPVISSRTYKKADRSFGVLQYSDRQAAEKCISKLNGKRVHGSDMRLQCVLGLIHGEHNQELNHEFPSSRAEDRCQREKHVRSRSRSRPEDRCQRENHARDRSPTRNWKTPQNKTGDVRPGDWTCGNCGLNIFASKDACFKCGFQKTPAANGRGVARGGDGEGQMTLFLIDLPVDIHEDELRDEFEWMSCGRKSILRVILKQSKNWANAFVRFSAVKYANRAFTDIQEGDIKVRGRSFRCFWSHTNTSLK